MEKLEIEFRYMDTNKMGDDVTIRNEFVFFGLYETTEQAVAAGNEILKILSANGFEVRKDDIFRVVGLFGFPDRLVSNCCYKDSIKFFAKITNLKSNDLNHLIKEAQSAVKRYRDYKIRKDD